MNLWRGIEKKKLDNSLQYTTTVSYHNLFFKVIEVLLDLKDKVSVPYSSNFCLCIEILVAYCYGLCVCEV